MSNKQEKCPNGWGSRFGYSNRGCRCSQCTEAQAKYVKEYRHRDPQKHRDQSSKWRERNPEKVVAYMQRYRSGEVFKTRYAERLDMFNKMKTDRGCVDCGFNAHPAALHFDHVRGEKKHLVGGLKLCSWESVLKEAEKCEVRCANCHAIRHFEEQRRSKDGTCKT